MIVCLRNMPAKPLGLYVTGSKFAATAFLLGYLTHWHVRSEQSDISSPIHHHFVVIKSGECQSIAFISCVFQNYSQATNQTVCERQSTFVQCSDQRTVSQCYRQVNWTRLILKVNNFSGLIGLLEVSTQAVMS